VPVRLRRHGGAKRIILRLDRRGEGVVVTLPNRVPESEGLAWAEGQRAWIAKHLCNLPVRKLFVDGAVVPPGGAPHVVCYMEGARRGVWAEDGQIFVSGRPEHLARRLTDWLRDEARRRLNTAVTDATDRLGKAAGRITVRDTRSRWGSCAANGNLSFSWRLVMAPEYVLEYVAAHEVAHLREAHHGPAFWRLVDELTSHAKAGRQWLRRHGEGLHFYG